MARQFARPVVVVSKCLGFAACRWNGVTIPDATVDALKPYVEFLPVCPEVEIGLGVPRDPIRVISEDGALRLFQPATGLDVTGEMGSFAARFLDALGPVDGFLLKSRSPSCGIKDTKVYPGKGDVAPAGRSAGFFGAAVLARCPALPVEDEGRLTNYKLREHFFTRLFALADFRAVERSNRMAELVRFQAESKLLLMAHHQSEMRALGRIVANRDRRPFDVVAADYREHLQVALANPPRVPSGINALMHALGYFSKELSAGEKALFLDDLQKYRDGRVPLSAVTSVLRSWIVRFQNAYLMSQTFFEPYPPGLIEVRDSGKARV